MSDYKVIYTMILDYEKKYPTMTNLPFLEFKAKMKIAKIYEDHKLPVGIVKLNSKLEIRNIKTNTILPVQIVIPVDEELNKFKLSVFSAIGMVLFGRKNGEIINCFEDSRATKLEILNII